MDFTEIYRQAASIVSFSPGTQFLLTAVHDRIIIRRTDSFQITRTWALDPSPAPSAPSRSTGSSSDAIVTHASWSCDSEYILGASARRGLVEVFKLRDEDWRARIEAGVEGLVKAEWAPDGRTVLCFSEWGLRVTIWSLVTGTATYIQYPIHPDRGYAFRSDGRYFVLAERHKSRDTLGVYDASTSYKLVRHFPLPTSSLSGISLSPNGVHVAVWDGPLEFKVHIVTLAGGLLGTYALEGDADPGFGVRTAAWHPAGLFLAVMGLNDKVHILESLTWGPIAILEPQTRIPPSVNIWREPGNWLEATHGRGFLSYERLRGAATLPTVARDRTKPPNFAGVRADPANALAFSADGARLLVRFESAPRAVHLFDFPVLQSADKGKENDKDSGRSARSRGDADWEETAREREREKAQEKKARLVRLRSVLLHSRPVTCARWNPVRHGSLALSTGEGSVYLWSDEWEGEDSDEVAEVAECIGVPAKQFATQALKWAPDGRGLVLMDRDMFCCAFEVEDEEPGEDAAS